MSTESLHSEFRDYSLVTYIGEVDRDNNMNNRSTQKAISNKTKQKSSRTVGKMSFNDYIRENSVNEDKENELLNKTTDQSCHVSVVDEVERESENSKSISQKISLPSPDSEPEIKLYSPSNYTRSTSMDEKNSMHKLLGANSQRHDCGVDTPDTCLGSNGTFSSTVTDDEVTRIKSERKRFTRLITCCSFWNGLLVLGIAVLTLLSVFRGQLFKHVTSQPYNMTTPYVGITDTNMSVYGVYSINETALKNEEKIRFIHRYDDLSSHGMVPSRTSPCVIVEYSGLYKVESQVTFKFARRISDNLHAKHILEIENDVMDKFETVTKRQISVPEYVLKSDSPHYEASIIAHLTRANAGDSICIITNPIKNVFTKMEQNVLNIELKYGRMK